MAIFMLKCDVKTFSTMYKNVQNFEIVTSVDILLSNEILLIIFVVVGQGVQSVVNTYYVYNVKSLFPAV